MSTNEGKEAYNTKEEATKFDESWYDKSYDQLMKILNANTKSDFVYIKYTYQQLGNSEKWFQEVCKLLKNSWPDIRREILLEWNTGVENSPFRPEDLDAISKLVKQPISTVYLLDRYPFESYLQTDTVTYPPIMGVDVSSGYMQDSSTITIIDSRTTCVLGCMNCNYVSTIDLARCIEFIVKHWMPNAVVNVERNGGYGSTVIAKLIKMGLKRNLYYEIKDVTVEDRQDGVHAYKQKIRTKVFGLNSTKDVRKLLIDILIERVENHKDKIISPIIYNELLGMEIKRNGKIEHSASTHDDQVFSMLMALYVWYEGINLSEKYGIRKTSIKTDDEVDEQIDYYNDNTVEIVDSFNQDDPLTEQIQQDINSAIAAGGTPLNEFLKQREQTEKEWLDNLIRTPLGEKAYREKYNIPPDVPLSDSINHNGSHQDIPDKVFLGFYDQNNDQLYNQYNELMNRNVTAVPEDQASMLNDENYNYTDYFNF